MPASKAEQSFRLDSWSIIYVETQQSDPVYLFYKQNPSLGKFVTMWSGAARVDEGPSISVWAQRTVPGIPKRLAECFAWHVTEEINH